MRKVSKLIFAGHIYSVFGNKPDTEHQQAEDDQINVDLFIKQVKKKRYGKDEHRYDTADNVN